MFRKYIEWRLKLKELFTENMGNVLYADVHGRFQINAKIYDIAKLRWGQNGRGIAVKGEQRGTANEKVRKQVFWFLPRRVHQS